MSSKLSRSTKLGLGVLDKIGQSLKDKVVKTQNTVLSTKASDPSFAAYVNSLQQDSVSLRSWQTGTIHV